MAREDKMHGGEHDRADEHQGSAFAHFVVYRPKKGREENSAKGYHTGQKSSPLGRYAIVGNHQFGGELKEGEYATVKQKTQQGDEPKAGIGEDLFQIFEVETLVFSVFFFTALYRCFKFTIHHGVNKEGQQADNQQYSTE